MLLIKEVETVLRPLSVLSRQRKADRVQGIRVVVDEGKLVNVELCCIALRFDQKNPVELIQLFLLVPFNEWVLVRPLVNDEFLLLGWGLRPELKHELALGVVLLESLKRAHLKSVSIPDPPRLKIN